MTTARLILRNLVFHWRTHLGVFLGTLVAAAILTGSLLVGDSVRFSLEQMALVRLGKIVAAAPPGEHFFRDRLAAEIEANLVAQARRLWHAAPTHRSSPGSGGLRLEARDIIAPVLMLRATVSLPDGRARANEVELIGVDERFWRLAPGVPVPTDSDGFLANDRLAAQLGLKPGDVVVIRVEEPSLLSRDAPLSGAADNSIAIRVRMKAVASPEQFGRFSLRANQVPPLTIFMPLRALQEAIQQPGRANALLAGGGDEAALNAALRKAWTLSDLNLEVRELPADSGSGTRQAELRTERVFLDPALAAAPGASVPGASGVLTYLVNEIRLGSHATPYSMVTAVDGAPGVPPLPDNEIAINAWLASDLGAKQGNELALRYFVVGQGRQLAEKTSRFRVRTVIPLQRCPDWMPPFPGLADVDNCRDWKPGIPIATNRIRPKDEEYWRAYRGTPKAFINLRAGQAAWENRFGNLTALRFPLTGTTTAREVEQRVRNGIEPKKAGLFFQPVRAAALKASRESEDFAGLFVSFSFFLIVAALLLTAMLFVFNIEQRTAETGLLLALGFSRRRIRTLLLVEGFAVAGLGTAGGVAAGALYARLALHGLSTVWKAAVNVAQFQYHAAPWTLAIGAGSSLLAGVLAMWLAGRGQVRRTPTELLAGGGMESGDAPHRSTEELGLCSRNTLPALAGLCVIGALTWLALAGCSPAAFFGAGALLLAAGIAFTQVLLLRLARVTRPTLNLALFGIRAAARRRGRSLTTVAVLASGIFMVVSVGAFREDPLAHARERTSGTGGFALFGRSTLPVYEDLNTETGRQAFGLSSKSMQGVRCVSLRMKEGDDASCLNLNRAQQPRFLGVRPQPALTEAFTFIETLKGTSPGAGWNLLGKPGPDGAVPAIGDEGTVRWALGKSLGDTLTCTDERGNPFQVRIVGMLANSILQGSLAIPEDAFVARFPSAAGYRVFLFDAPWENAEKVTGTLSAALQERGVEIVPAWRRLAEFQAVENSYLSIFQALGGLGLLLGSAGLGIVVARNVFERRNELALLRAIGFSPRSIRWLVVSEHWFLIALGIGIGGTAAGIAVLPSLMKPGAPAADAGIGLTLSTLAAAGAAWSWLAAWAATRGSLMGALRNE